MNILAKALYGLLYLLSLLPLWVHYIFSDVIYLIVYYVVRYRVKIVRKNLATSFPEKSDKERRSIEKRFYRWFGDYLVESVKLLSISKKQLRRRMQFKGLELVNQIVNEGRSCAVYLGHYCNWEWITSLPLWVSEKAQCGQIYHPLENSDFDMIFLNLRQRMGAVCIPMELAARTIIKYKQQQTPLVIGYIADQVPFWKSIHHWLDFLNHDTPVLTGTERMVRMVDHAGFYLDVQRIRRGDYVAEFKLVTLEPKKLPEFELTNIYFRLLEETIRRNPPYWLWTHNRWKRTHEEFLQRLDPETGIVDTSGTMWRVKQRMERKQKEAEGEAAKNS
jgi:KDO2-lipid IV(A) lauroyltransferase